MLVDPLHCLWLGIAQAWVLFAFNFLLEHNAWELPMPASRFRNELSLERLRHELFTYYRARAVARETRVQGLTLPMLRARQPFKGAETKRIVPFAVEALLAHRHAIPVNVGHTVALLLSSGQALQRYVLITDTAGPYPSDEIKGEIRLAGTVHIVHALKAGVSFVPKTPSSDAFTGVGRSGWQPEPTRKLCRRKPQPHTRCRLLPGPRTGLGGAGIFVLGRRQTHA